MQKLICCNDFLLRSIATSLDSCAEHWSAHWTSI